MIRDEQRHVTGSRGGEVIFERIIDPRMAAVRTPGRDGTVSIMQNLDDYDEFFAADVAKRYSVMTSGLEEDNQYHKQGRLNDAGEHAKRATIATQRASLNRASVQRGGTAMPPPGPPPMAHHDAPAKTTTGP